MTRPPFEGYIGLCPHCGIYISMGGVMSEPSDHRMECPHYEEPDPLPVIKRLEKIFKEGKKRREGKL